MQPQSIQFIIYLLSIIPTSVIFCEGKLSVQHARQNRLMQTHSAISGMSYRQKRQTHGAISGMPYKQKRQLQCHFWPHELSWTDSCTISFLSLFFFFSFSLLLLLFFTQLFSKQVHRKSSNPT